MNESEIFSAAVKLSAAERGKFLDLACNDDPAMRGQIEALLKAHFDSETFLHESSGVGQRVRANGLDETRDSVARESAGTVVGGKYKLLDKPIGEGGMGVRYDCLSPIPLNCLSPIPLPRQ